MTAARRVAAAFDRVAARYARRERANLWLALVKRRARLRLTAGLPPHAVILDACCGPGSDAARFAAAGFRVTAFDGSPAMAREARRRLARWARAGRARALHASLRDLPRRAAGLRGACDAVWCFWGAGFAPSLAPLARLCAFALKPGGRAVFTVPSRWCLWDIVAGLARGRPRAAFRRLAPHGVPLAFDGVPVRVHPLSLSRALAPFHGGFAVRRVEALGLLSPPPFLWRPGWRAAAPLWRTLDAVESVVGAVPPLPRLADHALVILSRLP